MAKKKHKRNPKQYRIVVLLILVIGIIYFAMPKNNAPKEEKTTPTVVMPEWEEDLSKTTNYITNITWTDDGVDITGTMPNLDSKATLKVCSIPLNECESSTLSINKNTFKGTLDLKDLATGSYEFKIASSKEEKLTDTRTTMERINRAHLGDKLVTMDYTNNRLKVTIEDFAYEYDILIDPGHGGDDIGSYNKSIDEERLNLEQSLYEKKRYEEHGLKVKMIREDHTYGILMGEDSWTKVRQRGYAMGYYGVVSRISYSNHHNSSLAKSYSGWEIIVPNAYEDIKNEETVASLWEKSYKVRDNHTRLYARNDEGDIFSRENKEIYNFTDYYAVVRIPYDLYHTKNTLYEGCYLSNSLDFDWYYTKGNWKTLSEQKIKTYVEALGKTYIPVK